MVNKFTQLSIIFSVLFVSACDESSSSPNNNAAELGHTYTYLEQTLAPPLLDPASCVISTRSCNVEELPFIGMSYPTPTIDNIMSRVVVSHDWMGERFSELLSELPSEVLTLLRSVTAIVIADDIRPSYYWTGSGAIYLDPSHLWLSNAEKATIIQDPDYRDGYSSGLSYDFFHRFTKDGKQAYQYYSLTSTTERNLDDIIIPMASLLFHELAHANDFMPTTLMSSVDTEQPIWREIARFSSQRLNLQLQQYDPITDSTLNAQAAILYLGDSATDEQKLQSAADLGSLFALEGANHLYSYSNTAEDVAMLFQATMLNYHYGVEMDSAFVIQPETDSSNCSDYIVAWGQRNRIADPESKSRAYFVSQAILSDTEFDTFFNELGDAQQFPALTDWCNTSLSETTSNSRTFIPSLKILQKDHHHGVIVGIQ